MRMNSFAALAVPLFAASAGLGCSMPAPWPASPLYEDPVNDPEWEPPATLEEAMAEMEGLYAHYDVVAYIADTPGGPFRTFVISYGFTELVLEEGGLVQYDRFCRAEYEANQNIQTIVPDAFTQAILPRSTPVTVTLENGDWVLQRPATPTLIGIDGNPDEPIPMDSDTPLINDDDGDGKPGITIFMTLYGLIDAELYISRREIFENEVRLFSDGSLRGTVTDSSEQLVIGATLGILDTPNNPPQWPDLGLSPLILIPAPEGLDTCDELVVMLDELFPTPPAF